MVPETELTVKVLGPLEVWSADGVIDVGGPRPRSLLALLVVARGEVVSPDRLIDELWDGTAPREARRTIQSYVSSIRRAMGGPSAPLASVGHGYIVDAERLRVDADEFERLLETGRERLATRHWEEALAAAVDALACWRGEAFADLPAEDIDTLAIERRRLHELRDIAADVRIDALLELGGGSELVPELQVTVSRRPERETSWQQLALAQHAAGRTVEALRTVDRLRRYLADEFGLPLSATTRAIERHLLNGDADAEPGRERIEVGAEAPCPYLGLASYSQSDANLFFGRDELVSVVLARMLEHPLVVVVGPSGVGKSSLVRAGVLPRLERGAIFGAPWITGVVDAASITTDDWGAFLARADRRRVLVVDQFETVLGQEPAERDRVVDLMLSTIRPNPTGDVDDRIIVVVRGDVYGEISQHRRLASLAEAATVLVGPMTHEELRRAIIEPARAVGLRVAPDLVDAVVADAEGHPGALPLVSHALVETWIRREDGTLTLDAYAAAGGVGGSLAQRAELTLARFDEDRQALARDLLLRLVDIGSDGIDQRHMSTQEQLAWTTSDVHESVIDTLAAARLITVGDHGIAFTHAVVVDAWPRLRSWVHESRQQLQLRQQIAEDARRWDRDGRVEHDLLRGPRLAAVAEWPAEVLPLGALERDYVSCSIDAAEADRRRLAADIQRQRRTNRRLRVLASATLAGVLATGALSFVAARQRERADELADIAVARQLANEATSRADEDLALSLLLAVEAVATSDRAETRRALAAALQQQPALRRLSPPVTGEWSTMAISADGSTAAMVRADGGDVRIRSLASGADPAALTSADVGDASRLAVAPAGSVVAVQRRDGSVVVVDPRDGQITRTLGAGPSAGAIAFSSDGRRLAVASGAGDDGAGASVSVFEVENGDAIAPAVDLGDMLPAAVAVTPDGTVAVVDVGGLVEIRDRGGAVRASWVGPLAPRSIAMDAAGDRVAVGGLDQIEVRQLSNDERRILSPTEASVADVAFTSDGGLVAAIGRSWTRWDAALRTVRSVDLDTDVVDLDSDDGGITVLERSGRVTHWSLDDWPMIATPTRTAAVAAVSPDGRFAAVADGTSGAVEISRLDATDPTGMSRSTPVRFTTGRIGDLRWSRSGAHLAAASTRGEVIVREVSSEGEIGNVVAGTTLSESAIPAVASDIGLLAAIGGDGSVRLVEMADGSVGATSEVRLGNGATVAAFDGATLLVGDDAGGLTRIDPGTGASERRQVLDGAVTALHADGPVLIGSADGEVRQVDWEDGRSTVVFDTGDDAVRGMDLTPDGRWVAAVTERGRTHVADVVSGVDGPILGADRMIVTQTHAIVLGHQWLHVWDGATLVRWAFDVEAWRAAACDLAGRTLTTTERHRHLSLDRGAPSCPG